MKSNLLKAKAMLPYVYEKAKFNSEDLFVILEGITGFFSGAMTKDPFAALGSALGVIRHFAGKCDLSKFRNNLERSWTWITKSMDCSGKMSRIRTASGVSRAGNRKSPRGFRAYKSTSRN